MACGKPVERIRAATPEAAASDAAFGRDLAARLDRIALPELGGTDRATASILRYHARVFTQAEEFYWHEPRLTPYAQPFQWIAPAFAGFVFESPADVDRYRGLLEDYLRIVQSLRAFAQGQLERGLCMPRVEIGASVAQLRAACTPEGYAHLIPAAQRLSALPSGADSLRTALEAAVRERIVPALHDLAEFLEGPYRAGAPDAVGQRHYPRGEEFYRYAILRNTTLDLSFDEIHVLGLTELERIEEELAQVRSSIGFSGGTPEFYEHLRTDRRFFARDAAQMQARLERYVLLAAPRIPEFFGVLPSAPYRLEQLPAEYASAQTFGYYQSPTPAKPVGTYFFNASDPSNTSLLSAGSLILHELVPGHHFQISRQQENAALPEMRRYLTMTAFCEGYAEYAAELGFEMGVYEDPYDRAGRLMQDAMISCRLVVDTGMNALGWTLEQARRFMRSHTLLSEREIAGESLRYSCDLPAQALAYKIGELALLQLRERSRKRFGARFDLRAFHDWLLDAGAVTLDALQ